MDSAPVEGLKAEGLRVCYGKTVVLKGLSISVGRGEVIAIIGRSGCGKSTLLKSLTGLQTIMGGDIWLEQEQLVANGRLLQEGWAIRRKMVLVPQGPSLLPHLTASENIALPLRVVERLTRLETAIRVEEVAVQLGVSDHLQHYPEELSGGQLQRVQLARALVLNPAVLLLDEITSSLDPLTIKDVVDALFAARSLPGGSKRIFVVVTHLLGFARAFSDRVAFLHEGVIHEEGNGDNFFESSAKTETREFLRAASWLA